MHYLNAESERILTAMQKCDENKSSCSRCMSAGRRCDGYYQHLYSVLEPQPSQALRMPYSRLGDARAVELFSVEVAQSFRAPHNSFFWTDHVLQLSCPIIEPS